MVPGDLEMHSSHGLRAPSSAGGVAGAATGATGCAAEFQLRGQYLSLYSLISDYIVHLETNVCIKSSEASDERTYQPTQKSEQGGRFQQREGTLIAFWKC